MNWEIIDALGSLLSGLGILVSGAAVWVALLPYIAKVKIEYVRSFKEGKWMTEIRVINQGFQPVNIQLYTVVFQPKERKHIRDVIYMPSIEKLRKMDRGEYIRIPIDEELLKPYYSRKGVILFQFNVNGKIKTRRVKTPLPKYMISE